MNKDIAEYHAELEQPDRIICDELHKIIGASLPKTQSKVWHGHPVWFIDGNPVVGYHKLKDSVRVLFWSGQSFDEPGLTAEGSFKAAEAKYTSVDQIDQDMLKRCLAKAQTIQWDHKNIVKNKGQLNRIS